MRAFHAAALAGRSPTTARQASGRSTTPGYQELKDFKTFCPKALCGIGTALPDTVTDRSIPIAMQRKTRDEHCERFRRREVQAEAEPLSEQLATWGKDAAGGEGAAGELEAALEQVAKWPITAGLWRL